MATVLDPLALVQPRGELSQSMFPSCDLNTMLEGWIAQAVTKVEANPDIAPASQQQAIKAWSYHLAYMYLADMVGAMPSSVSINNGADMVSHGQDRLNYWLQRALAKQAEYLELVGFVPLTTSTRAKSASIQTIGIW